MFATFISLLPAIVASLVIAWLVVKLNKPRGLSKSDRIRALPPITADDFRLVQERLQGFLDESRNFPSGGIVLGSNTYVVNFNDLVDYFPPAASKRHTLGALSATLAQLESVYGPDALMADLPESAKALLRGKTLAVQEGGAA